MAAEGGAADVCAFLAEAGVAQYADALVAAGYDSLPNVLALDELGLQDLKAAVNMLPGHFGFLRARINRGTTTAAPPPAAPPPAAAARPVPAQQAPRQARAPRTVGGCSRPQRAHWMLQVSQLQPMRAAPPSPTRVPNAWSAVRPRTLSASDICLYCTL